MDNYKVTFPAIKVVQPIGEFFIGTITANELVKISFADVRRIEGEQRDVEKYLGIQRPLDKTRVKKIKEYLTAPDASFPTGVVLAVDENCAEFDESGKMTLTAFNSEIDATESVPMMKIAKVLDGQHRIAAFTTDNGNFDLALTPLSNFQFNVVLFVGLDVDEQANIFGTVNLAQTKVNKSLVYDLEGLSKTRSPFRSGHQIAVALDSADDSSPLYERIKRLGVKTKGREHSEPLTQAVFVEALMKLISENPFADRTLYMRGKKPRRADVTELVKYPLRNMFLEEKDSDIAVVIFNYFSSIRNKWPNAWAAIDTEGNILPKSNAFRAFMRYLPFVYNRIARNRDGYVPSIEEFGEIMNQVQATDSDFTTGNFKPGSAGESDFYKLLKGELTIQNLKN